MLIEPINQGIDGIMWSIQVALVNMFLFKVRWHTKNFVYTQCIAVYLTAGILEMFVT